MLVELEKVKKELQSTLAQLMEENRVLKQKTMEQEDRLLLIEQRSEQWAAPAEDHSNILVKTQKQQRKIKFLLGQNCHLRKQLAQTQESLERLVRVHCSPGSSPPAPSGQSSTLTPLAPSPLQHTGQTPADSPPTPAL